MKELIVFSVLIACYLAVPAPNDFPEAEPAHFREFNLANKTTKLEPDFTEAEPAHFKEFNLANKTTELEPAKGLLGSLFSRPPIGANITYVAVVRPGLFSNKWNKYQVPTNTTG